MNSVSNHLSTPEQNDVTTTPRSSLPVTPSALLVVEDSQFNVLQSLLKQIGIASQLGPADDNEIALKVQQASYCFYSEQHIHWAEQFSVSAPACAQILVCNSETENPKEQQAHYHKPYSRLAALNTSALATAIEIGCYKAELRAKQLPSQQLFGSALSCIGDILIFLGEKGEVLDLNAAAAKTFGITRDQAIGSPWYNLIKTRRDLSAQHTEQFISAAIKTRAVTKIHPIAIATGKTSSQLMDGIVGPVQEGPFKNGVVIILRLLTSLDHLPVVLENKDGKQRQVTPNLVSGILLFSPDHLNKINLRYGHRFGDRILFEIGELLHDLLRPTDLTAHYGGAIFLVMFSETTSAQTENLVNQLRKNLLERKYTSKDINLTFSFGLALNNDLVTYSPVELFYYANFSLSQAQELGGDQIRQWRQRLAMQQIGNLDRLSGNFTDTGSSDYQKMLLLWNMLNNLESVPTRSEFVEQLLSQLCIGLELNKVAFFRVDSMRLELEAAVDAQHRALTSEQVRLSANQKSYVDTLLSGEQVNPVFTSLLADTGVEVLLPVRPNNRLQGMLWMACNSDHAITPKDHHLLINIADFIALKLEKLKTASPKIEQTTKSPATASSDFNFWYSSKAMKRQMEYIKMVAPTNATVLITGESGTGKEMLAKSVHQASERKDKPFVIFDCGAVVESLIESELFGHTKGAFTGASSATVGSIQEAHGGTLFLDEVGELPIETQVKLLRFVQEKQFAPVGSNQFKKVDVRVVAATNVDLEERIKQGLFRQDLYYRLNVFKLESLPLRERQDDILLLAENYLSLYAQEYSKQVDGFSAEAQQALLQYPWPGNVRELKNLIHRAVVLCADSVMQCNHLGLYPSNKDASVPAPEKVADENIEQAFIAEAEVAPVPERETILPASDGAPGIVKLHNTESASPAVETNRMAEPENNIAKTDIVLPVDHAPVAEPPARAPSPSSETFAELIEFAIRNEQQPLIPVAPILEFMLYRSSLAQAQNVTLQAANLLNIAESTFRRRWKKLQQLASDDVLPGADLFEQASQQLLSQATEESRINLMQNKLASAIKDLALPVKQGCTLMDMSAPTYRKLLAGLNE
ncbi:MAG: sigma 54-interacting transcriptional regulator [Aestuariibacter sp.]